MACPKGDRATLAAALAGEFPALANPEFAWGHEHALPVDGNISTLLHFETQPALRGLATRLAQRGLAVDSAWPLATFLHTLREEQSESAAVTVVALQTQRAVAYRHLPDSARSALRWHGESVVSDVGAWLGELLTRDAEDSVLLVCAGEEIANFRPNRT